MLLDKEETTGYRSSLITARALLEKQFAPIKYIVPGLVVEGLTLFAGAPKIGKSWLWLKAALAVASGGFCLGEVKCNEAGDVLYLALEDNQRRLFERVRVVWEFEQNPIPERLTFATEWPRGQEGVDRIRDWLDEHPDARLVIVDVLQMFRPIAKDKNQGNYEADYISLKMLQGLALEKHVGVVVVHHTRKSVGQNDYVEKISGTMGLSGAADTNLILERGRNGAFTLEGRGRDIEEVSLAMKFDKVTREWSILGDAEEIQRSSERAEVLSVLKKASEPMGPKDLAAICGKTIQAITSLLFRMDQAGEVMKVGRGQYVHPERTDLMPSSTSAAPPPPVSGPTPSAPDDGSLSPVPEQPKDANDEKGSKNEGLEPM